MYVYSRLIVAGAHHSVFVARSVSLSVSQSLSVSVHNRTAQRIGSTRLSDEPVQRDDINGVPTGTTSSLDLISLSNSVYTCSQLYNRLLIAGFTTGCTTGCGNVYTLQPAGKNVLNIYIINRVQ